MKKSICGADCENCGYGKKKRCRGCLETAGCPFGKPCFIAKYIGIGGMEGYLAHKKMLLAEINELGIPGLYAEDLYPLNGAYVNLAYPMPNGSEVKLLSDDTVYLGTQVASLFGDGEGGRCYGVVAGPDFILVSEFGVGGQDPELILYKRR